jgi:hypothetical protein
MNKSLSKGLSVVGFCRTRALEVLDEKERQAKSADIEQPEDPTGVTETQ